MKRAGKNIRVKRRDDPRGQPISNDRDRFGESGRVPGRKGWAADNQKVDERVQTATKKNAAIDPEQFKALSRRLEYFDLRELQETVLSKALWPLQAKFGQLAELRNRIRRIRSVDEITREEGEAPIPWFKQVQAR